MDPETVKQVKDLYENAKQSNRYNVSTVTYEYSKKTTLGRLGYGRLYAVELGSLERIERTVRHSLCANLYWDIDMVNAHPTILSQLAAKHGVDMKNLTYYVENREKVLAHMVREYNIKRGEAKEWVIQCIFGSKMTELQFLQRELKELADVLSSVYAELYDNIQLLKKKNRIGCFISYVAQTEECKCLRAMIDFFESRGRRVGVLSYDGCMILKDAGEPAFPEALLRECEAFILERTGFSLKLAVKHMEISPDFNHGGGALYKSEVDDLYMTKKFVLSMGDNLQLDSTEGVVVYDPSTGLWDNKDKTLRKAMCSANLVEDTPEGVVNYSGYAYKQDQVVKILPSQLSETDFVFRAMKRSIGKFLFTNGIYDVVTRTFKEGYDPSLYFCTRINRAFPKVRDEAKIARVNRLIFQDPFLESEQELGVYYKKVISRAVAGYFEDKTFIIGVGTPNSGKGVLTTALQQTFGEYIGDFQADSFKINKFGSQDAAKELSWMQAFWKRRLGISNETGPESVYSGTRMKAASSGGDRITSRLNFQDEKAMVNMATLLMLCNDIPKIHPIDTALINRLVIVEYKLSFVDTPSLPHERQLDSSVRNLFDTDEYRDAFFWVLMDAFEGKKPARCGISIASAREWTPAPSTSFKDALEGAGYVIDTQDEDAWVPFSELKQVLVGCDAAKGMSDTAIGKELGRLGIIACDVKSNGKKYRARKFIRKLQEVEEEV